MIAPERGRGGAYLLVLRLEASRDIAVGSLGRLHFKRGTYVYAGSALPSLRARVERHFSSEKKLHWHVDHLRLHARPMEALVLRSDERLECLLNEMVGSLDGACPCAPGFGCSDCGCATHLHLVGAEVLRRLERFLPERMLPAPARE